MTRTERKERTVWVSHPPVDEEAPFSVEELFFSRTDERGIILSGNSVFQRIAQFGWDEMLRKPHNIIRHPDMPKVVFWLLWDTIKKGQPIGAYVKNKAKDGKYYWVFALVTPIEGGYLSVRLKPTSTIFSIVAEEYKTLIDKERHEGMGIAESAGLLLNRLAALGFADYAQFMTAALAQEMAARDEQLGRPADSTITNFNDLTQSAQQLLKLSATIFSAYESNQYVPLNLQVQAAQLGENGRTIATISDNYSIISNEIKNGMDRFLTSVQEVSATITSGMLLSCIARLQEEVIGFFEKEPASEHIAQAEEMHHLQQQKEAYRKKAAEGLRDILNKTQQFRQECSDMKRLAAGLEVTRVMGKVETARQVVDNGLSSMIEELGVLQTTLASSLKDIEQMNGAIAYGTERLLSATG